MLLLEKLCLQPWIGFLVKIGRKMSFKKKREIHFLTSFSIEMWITLPTYWWITLLSLPTLYWWITLPVYWISLIWIGGSHSLGLGYLWTAHWWILLHFCLVKIPYIILCWTVKYWCTGIQMITIDSGLWTGNRAKGPSRKDIQFLGR